MQEDIAFTPYYNVISNMNKTSIIVQNMLVYLAKSHFVYLIFS